MTSMFKNENGFHSDSEPSCNTVITQIIQRLRLYVSRSCINKLSLLAKQKYFYP